MAPLCTEKHGLVDSIGHTLPSDVILKVDSSLLCRDPLVGLIPPKGFTAPTLFPGPGSRRALVSVYVPGNTLFRTVLASAFHPHCVRWWMMIDDAQIEDWTSNLDGGGTVPSSLRPYRLGAVFLSGWNRGFLPQAYRMRSVQLVPCMDLMFRVRMRGILPPLVCVPLQCSVLA